jgi:hypothetical protein
MSAWFLILCGMSILFYGVFLAACITDTRRRSKRAVVLQVPKVPQKKAVDSAAGRRFLVQLETEMAEFLTNHGRTAAMIVLAMVMLPLSLRAQPQTTQVDGPPAGGSDQAIPPAVQKQLDVGRPGSRYVDRYSATARCRENARQFSASCR